MKFPKLMWRLLMCAVPLLALATSASATSFSGYGWVNNANADNATIANIPTTTPDFTFTASAVDFSSFGNLSNTGNGSLDYTVGSFLTSLGSASDIVYSSPGIGSDSADNILMEITGTAAVTNGESFTVAHDDGLTLVIGGVTVVNAPGETAPTTTVGTYTGPTGNESFTLVYGECCGAPAVLETTITGPAPTVPEPSVMLLTSMGLFGLGFARRKLFA